MKGGNRRQCRTCEQWITKANFARHRRMCDERHGEREGEERQIREGMGRGREKVKECNRCGRALSTVNMACNQSSCRVWDPGEGTKPLMG